MRIFWNSEIYFYYHYNLSCYCIFLSTFTLNLVSLKWVLSEQHTVKSCLLLCNVTISAFWCLDHLQCDYWYGLLKSISLLFTFFMSYLCPLPPPSSSFFRINWIFIDSIVCFLLLVISYNTFWGRGGGITLGFTLYIFDLLQFFGGGRITLGFILYIFDLSQFFLSNIFHI